MKYLIEPRTVEKKYPVCSAKGDAAAILTKEGYLKFYIDYPTIKNKMERAIRVFGDYMRLGRTLKNDDTVFIQWPVGILFESMLYKRIVPPKVKDLYILVHDISSLRNNKPLNDVEKHMYSMATGIILHSEKMKKYIIENGIDGDKVQILQCFDYLTKDEIKRKRTNSNVIVSVATTERSPFLTLISDAHLGIHVNLYGKYCDDYEIILGNDITYKGTFKSDEVSTLQGSWGLVWDGDSVDTCSSAIGEYMRYNSPHKVSLFIAAHLPIIIWDKAAKADYVKEKGLGITVSSLRQIKECIESISDEEYARIIKNLENESELIRNGEHLKECLRRMEAQR